jgi:serine phosphatase RsbU (regulator of sigma subunit)
MDNIHLRDGMDLSFCAIDIEERKLEFAGAFNPVYIVRNGEIIEIKGDKNMLGPNIGLERKPFRNHEIKLQEEDTLYLFSDGYADQFGGPEGKKFKYRRFRHLILSIYEKPLSVQKHVLDKRLNEWKGNLEHVDDILVLGVKPLQKSRKIVYKRDSILSTSSSI